MPDMILCPHCMAVCNAGVRVCPACGRPMQCANGDHQLPIGTFLNKRYLVGCAIGGGGFGITYVGYDTLLNIKVAIKEYYPSGAANRSSTAKVYPVSGGNGSSFETGKERFLNEAAILSGFIGDSGIVTLRDFFEANGTAYIIMEFLEGQDLREYLDGHGALSFDEALELMTPAIKALERVHAKGIIHGDISPSNIMRLNSGEIKILDFGTARNQGSDENYNSSMMLKPGYAPEEQFRQQGELGPWTDVYAISATIYKLITNVTPENSTDRFFKDTLVPPAKLGAKIRPAQEAALLKGMAVSAKNRTRTMGELLENLNRSKLSAGETVKRLFDKTAVRIGLAAAAAAVAVLCFVLPQKQADNGTGEAQSPSAQGERVQAATLSEDAYPFPMYAGMEKTADFAKTVIVSDSKKHVEVTDCFIGNGMLCFIVEAENKSSADGNLTGWYIENGQDWIECADWIGGGSYTNIGAGEKTRFGVWFCTDTLYVRGLKNFSKLNLSVGLNEFEGDYVTASGAVYFPHIIRIDSSIDTSPVTLYSDDVFEIVCYGVSLREDNYTGYALIAARAADKQDKYNYVSGVLQLNGEKIYADGAKIFDNTGYKYMYIWGNFYKEDWDFYEFSFNYGYSAPVDEMNVMHSGKELPKTITLSFDMGTEFDKTDIFADKEITFNIGSDGIGHAA